MKIKLLYISPSFYPATRYGGPIFSTFNTCRELSKLDVDLDIHTTNANLTSKLDVSTVLPTILPEMNNVCVNYHDDLIINRLSPSLLLEIFRRSKLCSIIHTQSVYSIPTPISIFSAYFYRKNVVVSPRGSLGDWCMKKRNLFKRLWLFLFFRPFINRIYWHVTAKSEADEVIEHFPNVKRDHILVIPNGIEKKDRQFLDKATLLTKLGLKFSSDYIVSSGRIDRKKGFDYTIKALEKVEKLHLVIMGADYGEMQELIDLASELNISDRVHFVGHLEDDLKWSLYHHSRLFVLNSRHENFGNVYLEALSVGVPIIASNHTPWGFINGTGAGLCVENTPESIASSIEEIISNSGFSSCKCISVASMFYWEEIAKKFKEEYERIIYDN
ncbi:TPA: glycosyltransferase [Vibrio cholerae]